MPAEPAIGFSPVAPVYEGGYFMRCAENDYAAEWVAVYWRDGTLRAKLDLGDYPLSMIHQGLTDVTWRRAISVTEASGTTWQNAALADTSGGLRDAAWEEVTKEVFDQFLAAYPRPLEKDITRICEPPMLTYNDFSEGKVWPQSVVAKAKLYDGSEYHGGRGPVYFLQNRRGAAATAQECYRQGRAAKLTPGEVTAAMDKLTDDERMEVMGNYCKSCGGTNPGCQCWNDE